VTNVKLSDIIPDDRNANRHTERGEYMLRRSMERFGFLEPGVLDANNRIIGGNSRTEAAADVLDTSEAVVIDIDGKTPVFVRRRDLDLTTPEGREAAIALNRTAQVGIEFDASELDAHLSEGVDVSDWFRGDELDALRTEDELDMREPADRRELGDAKRQIKAVLYSDQVETLERAILATGEQNRGKALIQICEAYLDATGQFNFQV
jgi:hypothetical protein